MLDKFESIVQKETLLKEDSEQLQLALKTLEKMRKSGLWKEPEYPLHATDTLGKWQSNVSF